MTQSVCGPQRARRSAQWTIATRCIRNPPVTHASDLGHLCWCEHAFRTPVRDCQHPAYYFSVVIREPSAASRSRRSSLTEAVSFLRACMAAHATRDVPRLCQRVNTDRRRGLPRERLTASIIRLLNNTLIRIGNHTYRKKTEVSALPLSTLGIWRFTAPASASRFEENGARNGG